MYPFNPRAVLDHDPCAEVPIIDSTVERPQEDNTGKVSQLDDVTDSTSIACTFTAEEELKFATRFAEGYTLHDPKYIA